MKTPKIMLGLPTMGTLHTLLSIIIMSWISDSWRDKKYDLTLYPTIGVTPVDNARNEIVREFLKTDATHLLFIDADTVPPQDTIEKLLSHNKDIVSGITPIIEITDDRKPWKKPNCVDMDNNYVTLDTGLVEIKGAGSSCILIKREVFEKLSDPWYRFRYEDDNGKKTFNGEPLIISEDIHFVMQAITHGFHAYCDTSVVCGHNKAIVW